MSYHLIAVYWPGQGYGGADRVTESEIESAIQRYIKLGYGRKENPIHVIKRTDDVVIRVVDDATKEPTP